MALFGFSGAIELERVEENNPEMDQSRKVLLDPENGFIKDDVVILRAHVKAEMPQSAKISNLRAFASSISHSSDGTLILGANKIPIHKTYLSYYSEYFKTMFESEFIEGRQHEIVLEEVGYVDMLQHPAEPQVRPMEYYTRPCSYTIPNLSMDLRISSFAIALKNMVTSQMKHDIIAAWERKSD
ncbi:BTB/POZ domain-containing protein [Ditylenchus destructor]|uniref:BTB/POZ domain-containing protein n=1 Tax=Ditylenchus destructor TaxID=166010 RepID=A0AAD4QVK6_9BILA|nr:BTB/POZ domain-containing protein [Ditylenchus destructor]